MSALSTLQKLDDARAFMLKHGNIPAPSDPFITPHWEMCGVHAMLLLGLRNIYEKAPTIAAVDYHDFTLYCLFWVAEIHHHHHVEEDFYFDGLKGAISTSDIVQEHDGLRSNIDDIKTYLESCLPAGTKWGPYAEVVPSTSPNNTFDAARLLKLIDALTEAFVKHFCDEIEYLEPAKLRVHLSLEDIQAANKRMLDHVYSLPKSFHVFAYVHMPHPYFPPIPWFPKNVIIPWVLYWQDRHIWRFGPKDAKLAVGI